MRRQYTFMLISLLALSVMVNSACGGTSETEALPGPTPLPVGWVPPAFDMGGTYLYSKTDDGYAVLTLSCMGRGSTFHILIGWGPGDLLGPMQENVPVQLRWDGQETDESSRWEVPVGLDSLSMGRDDNDAKAAFALKLLQHSTLEVIALTSTGEFTAKFELGDVEKAMASLGAEGITCTSW